MAGPELHFITIAEASRRISQRELSPVELTETYLQRISAIDNQLMSFVTLTAELARQRARERPRQRSCAMVRAARCTAFPIA